MPAKKKNVKTKEDKKKTPKVPAPNAKTGGPKEVNSSSTDTDISDDDTADEAVDSKQKRITDLKGIKAHNPSLKSGPPPKRQKVAPREPLEEDEEPSTPAQPATQSSTPAIPEGHDSMLRRVVMTRIETLNTILDMDVVATIIPPSFTGGNFLEITATTSKDPTAFKKVMSSADRQSLARKRVQQTSSRQLYSQSLSNLIARTDIRRFKDADNHWIKESEVERKQLLNAMVSQYSSALILLGVVNVDETIISKDLQKRIHKM